jgi:membrane-bound inhibitor of C-type lysozyme
MHVSGSGQRCASSELLCWVKGREGKGREGVQGTTHMRGRWGCRAEA